MAIVIRPGGFGAESFGDPMGGGGPLSVLAALAVGGQTVRVVFSIEPQHKTPAGGQDALNPANYALGVAAGRATAPAAVGVDRALVLPGAWGVPAGTDLRALDVHVDRQLIAGITYTVAARQMLAAAGGGLGSPVSASFAGVVSLQIFRPPERPVDFVDIANPPAIGHFVVDSGCSLAIEDPEAGTKKRILRRLSTRRGAFSTLRNYGLALSLKGVTSNRQLTAWRSDAVAQILSEPDVTAASVQVSLAVYDVVFIDVRARTRRGNQLALQQKFVSGIASE